MSRVCCRKLPLATNAPLLCRKSTSPYLYQPYTWPRLFHTRCPLWRDDRHQSQKSETLEVNAPDFTNPPPLETPKRGPECSTISHLWQTGKAYGRFYWTGSKRIVANRKATRSIKQDLQRLLNLSVKSEPSGWRQAYERYMCRSKAELAIIRLCEVTTRIGEGSKQVSDRVDRNFRKWSRADLQALIRYERDRTKLPVFVLAVLLLGEWLALLLPLLPVSLFPRACRTPGQVRSVFDKAQKARSSSFAQGGLLPSIKLGSLAKDLSTKSTSSADLQDAKILDRLVDSLSERQVAHVAKCLGTRNSSSQVLRHLRYLWADDLLLHRAGDGAARLSAEELQIACHERGMDVSGVREADLRRAMVTFAEVAGSQAVGKVYFACMLLSQSGWQKMQAGKWTVKDALDVMKQK